MSKSVNKVILLGRLGGDAETVFTTGGTALTTFSLATDHPVKDGDGWKQETDWHRIKIFNGETISSYLLKGKQVYLEGRLQQRKWEDRNGEQKVTTEIICESRNVILLSEGPKGTTEARTKPKPEASKTVEAPGTFDDVPF